MTQKYVTKAVIKEEPYLLQVKFYIRAEILPSKQSRRTIPVKGIEKGQGSGANIISEIDRLQAMNKCFDTAWYQFINKKRITGKTGLIVSRSFRIISSKITYYGYQRSFQRIKRNKKLYIVKRNEKGKFISWQRLEYVSPTIIREDAQLLVKNELTSIDSEKTITNVVK